MLAAACPSWRAVLLAFTGCTLSKAYAELVAALQVQLPPQSGAGVSDYATSIYEVREETERLAASDVPSEQQRQECSRRRMGGIRHARHRTSNRGSWWSVRNGAW